MLPAGRAQALRSSRDSTACAAKPGPCSVGRTLRSSFLRRRVALQAIDTSALQQQQQQLQQQQAAQLNGNGESTAHQQAAAGISRPSGSIASLPDEDVNGLQLDGIQLEQQQQPTGLYVRVRGMVKHFNTAKGVFRAVDGVDVDVPPSSICALLGPSGSGKTTLLRLVAGLELPTGGKIYFDDLDATDLAVQDRQVGMVFQSYALFNHMTVAENIKFGLQVRKLPVDHDKRAADLLELVQLTGLGDRYPRQLSGGQRQRVALARALASNPRLLLLDEPFGALDAVVRKQLRAGLKEIVRSVGVTTIIVTHDQEEAFDLADQVVIFNRGLIEQSGSPNEIIKRPATSFVMGFVGDTNSVPAGCMLVRRSGFHPAQGKARVMFRPSDIRLSKEYVAAMDGQQVTPATVNEAVNMGWTMKYTLKFDDDVEVEFSVTRAQAEGEFKLDVGQRIYVVVPPSCMMEFDEAELGSAPIV
ncbi:chloroplast ATP-binding protein [Scenedesmus sp. NREL 46B-D3]|nr:chloroplast ATP-binding protein [Scenedesmus sp. NREL 46B-D3]